MATLNIDVAQAGMLISAATLINIFITAPIGFMISKIGIRKAGLLSMAFLFSGSLIGSFMTSYHTIMIAMFLGGVGHVFISVSGLVFINLLFSKGKLATATSIYTSSGVTAQFVTFILLPNITSIGNIKPAWRIDLVLAFVCFLLWIIFVQKRFITNLEQENAGGGENEKPLEEGSSYVKRVLTNPSIWKLSFSLFLFMIVAMGVLGYLPSYLVSERGFDLKFASFICSFNALVGFVCMIFAGFLADRFNTNKWIFFVATVVMAALRLLQVTVPMGPLLIMITVIQGIPAAGPTMIFSAIGRVVTDPKEKSIAMAIVMTAFLTANALSPLIFGFLVRSMGYSFSHMILAPVAVISLIGIFTVKNLK